MESWDDTFRELQQAFLAGLPQRQEALKEALDRLSADRSDRAALGEARLRFHGFAGAGGTYGFPEASSLGREGEAACDRVLAEGRPLSADEVAALRRIAGELASTLSTPCGVKDSVREEAIPPDLETVRRGEVVVWDDEPRLRDSLAGLLSRDGMAVRVCESPEKARMALAERVPDVLVVPLAAGGAGLSLIGMLRDLPGGDGVLVAAISAGAGFLDKVDAISSGADFYVEKPVDPDGFLSRIRGALEASRAEIPRILSVEDDPDQGAFIKAVLEAAGYEVRLLPDPRRFESETASFGPDLILMDVNLPGVKGYELVRYLRHDERFATTPVVFLTSERGEKERIAALRAGGDDHLAKPVSPALLLSSVASRLERARLLKSLLIRDGLTGLLTHTAFLERARALVAASQRMPERLTALVLIDLDHFKDVNDTHGHPVGDRVLASLGALLRRRLRGSDAIGRLGGEEFALLLEDLQGDEAVRLVGRLLQEFQASRHVGKAGEEVHVTFSAGIALLDPATMTLETWRQAADSALYAAKAAGRNRIELHGKATFADRPLKG